MVCVCVCVCVCVVCVSSNKVRTTGSGTVPCTGIVSYVVTPLVQAVSFLLPPLPLLPRLLYFLPERVHVLGAGRCLHRTRHTSIRVTYICIVRVSLAGSVRLALLLLLLVLLLRILLRVPVLSYRGRCHIRVVSGEKKRCRTWLVCCQRTRGHTICCCL